MRVDKFPYPYKQSDKVVVYHQDDDDLVTIKIRLPSPPPFKTIDGYGLPPEKQMFTAPKMPKRLVILEKSCESIGEVWEKLNHYQDIYQDEIAFIEREWDRTLHGYWFFSNGKPVFIDGWHYKYLVWWKIDIGLPEYRSRDRKFFHFARYCYTTTEAYYPFRVIDRKTKAILQYFHLEKELLRFLKDKDPDIVQAQKGDFFIDLGRRICYGFTYPKHRREGATYKALEILVAIISITQIVHGGIQSLDGTSAKKAFLKAVTSPWKKLPFFFSPLFSGSTDPQSKLTFDVPAQRIGGKGSSVNINSGLESFIDFGESAGRSTYDGDKLKVLHNDEVGKTLLEDVNARWDVQKKCLATGAGIKITGLSLNTSTVGEMSEKGGKAFFRLCSHSHFDKRNQMGQTQSGLFNLFIPAYDGLEGYIDIFGESIIDDPPESEIWRWEDPKRDVNGRLVGAKRALDETLEEILLREDEESIKEYEEEVRLHPTSFAQCFITAGSGSGLDMKKIVRRIKELMFDRSMTQKGNFQWKNGIVDSEVVWVPEPVNGRWWISLQLNTGESNLKISEQGMDPDGLPKTIWRPLKPWKFTAGADPYKFRKTEGKRISDGGGSVFYERDKTIDPDGKLQPWETYRTVCTYSNRPWDPNHYAEDMLMMCIYYGAMMFPEVNVPLVWDHFVNRGYDGYLKYMREPSGAWRKTPGFSNLGKYPQKIMQLHQNYIANFIDNERHMDILLQAKKIKGVEDLTNHDLFTAVGASYIGSETSYAELYKEDDDDVSGYGDISDFF